MTLWVATSADYEAVREGIREMLRAQMTRSSVSLAPDLAAWVGHLSDLRSQLESGVLEAAALTADEAAGVRMLNEEAEAMSRKKRCARCGAPTDGVFNCTTCGAPMAKNG